MRGVFGLAAAAVLLATTVVQSAQAQSLPPSARQALEDRVNEYEAVLDVGDGGALLPYVPPTIRRNLVRTSGLSESQIREGMREATAPIFGDPGLQFDFDMTLKGSATIETPDGSRVYVLVPTVTQMSLEGHGRHRVEFQTLALLDEGAWYFVRVADPEQLVLLLDAYPEFAGVSFPAEELSMELDP